MGKERWPAQRLGMSREKDHVTAKKSNGWKLNMMVSSLGRVWQFQVSRLYCRWLVSGMNILTPDLQTPVRLRTGDPIPATNHHFGGNPPN